MFLHLLYLPHSSISATTVLSIALLSLSLFLLFLLPRKGSDQVTPPVLSVEHPTTLHLRSSEERIMVSTGVTLGWFSPRTNTDANNHIFSLRLLIVGL